MDEPYFKKIVTTVLLVALIVLSFLLLKPILLSIIFGLILAFIFAPVYDKLLKVFKYKNLTASLICIVLILLIVIPFWFLTPILVNQSIKVYMAAQQMDFVTPLKKIFPSLFASTQFSQEIGSIIYSFITKVTNSLMNSISSLILDFPTLALQILVVFFTFFFSLRDKEKFIAYIKSLLPFSSEVEKKLFANTAGITSAVIYGQVIVGILQGIIVSISLFLFGVPNALILSLVAILVSIIPHLGPFLIWVPVAIYFFIGGNNVSAWGITIFGAFASTIDNFLRPLIVAKRTRISSAIMLIGMIGGVFFLGVLGLIIGPLILAYLLVVLEIYRNKKIPGLITKE